MNCPTCGTPEREDCGICGGYHPEGFNGDCRDDENRFTVPCDCWLTEDERNEHTLAESQ